MKTANCDTLRHVAVFITCSFIHLNFKQPPQQFAFYAEIEAFVVTAMKTIKTKTNCKRNASTKELTANSTENVYVLLERETSIVRDINGKRIVYSATYS